MTDPTGLFDITIILCQKYPYFWPVLVKIGSKEFEKTLGSAQFDEIFQMVPILILFKEKKFGDIFPQGGPLPKNMV